MNYSKLAEELKNLYPKKNSILPEKTGMTMQGINKTLKNKTLTVKTLEALSSTLQKPVSYWFDDDPFGSEARKDELTGRIKELEQDKRNMQSHIELLESMQERVNIKKDGTSG